LAPTDAESSRPPGCLPRHRPLGETFVMTSLLPRPDGPLRPESPSIVPRAAGEAQAALPAHTVDSAIEILAHSLTLNSVAGHDAGDRTW
jgi:hypothetical protein